VQTAPRAGVSIDARREAHDDDHTDEQRNGGGTDFLEIPNRGHALTIDSGWREVADTALQFVKLTAMAPKVPRMGVSIAPVSS
jgi:hypothetical protein